MESPIDPRIWKYMFHIGATSMSLALFFSLWRQRNDALGRLNGALRRLSKKSEDVEATLREIATGLDEESASKKGASKLGVQAKLTRVLQHVKLADDGSNTAIIIVACKIFVKACTGPEGRTAFYEAGGYRRLMHLLAEANRTSNFRVMEEAAYALFELTHIEPESVVLPADVPAGAEGAYVLASYPSTVKMLRTLDPNAKASLLTNVVGIFANLCVLRAGTKALQEGVDGKNGAWYFLRLLHHSNELVIERAARALRYLANQGSSQHAEICKAENVRRITLLMKNTGPVQDSLLNVCRIMLESPSVDDFFQQFVAEDGVSDLFRIWCNANEKISRDRAESLIHMLEKTKSAGPTVVKLMEVNRANIHERRAKDEEARRKQMQQMKQQQMFQQMMMAEMMGGGGGGGGGGMPPGMDDE